MTRTSGTGTPGSPVPVPVPPEQSRPPEVPGYRTGRLLGFGGSGEVWSAVQEASGRDVALKVVPVAEADRTRVLRECMLLRRIEHQHVVRLHGVVDLGTPGVVLVLERAPGGSLAALVAARGALDPGEVVTILSPLASALADLHARGLVHGDVSPGNVLFAADGRPMLADLGVSSLVGLDTARQRHGTPGYIDPAMLAGGTPTPGTDVFGLCATGWFALTGRSPQPSGSRPPLIPLAPDTPADLAALVEKGLDPQPARRPGASQLAVKVFDAAPATPVRLVPTDPGAAAAEVVTHRLRVEAGRAENDEERPSRWRSRSRLLLAGAVTALVAAAAGALVVSTGALDREAGTAAIDPGPSADEAASTDAPSAAPGAPGLTAPTPAATAPEGSYVVPTDLLRELEADDPVRAVPALAQLRAVAYAAGSGQPLEAANVPGSQSLASDGAVLDALAAEGLLLEGLSFEVRRSVVLSRSGDTAVVEVDVVTGEHRRVRAADGSVVDVQPASPPVTSRLTLLRIDDRWRISTVS